MDTLATRQFYRNLCDNSGRNLIRIIIQHADNAPASAGMAIEAMMQAHFENGLSEHTLVAFNAFYHEYDRFNRALPAHQRLSEGVMAEKLAHTVRRIGESVGTYLDVKLALSSATGRLAPTIAAIRDVLGELEAREYKRNIDTSSSGRAFLARNPRNPKSRDDPSLKEKQRDPKRHREKPN
eukprot:6213914-Pleurochrysis_carterae.AAC.1